MPKLINKYNISIVEGLIKWKWAPLQIPRENIKDFVNEMTNRGPIPAALSASRRLCVERWKGGKVEKWKSGITAIPRAKSQSSNPPIPQSTNPPIPHPSASPHLRVSFRGDVTVPAQCMRPSHAIREIPPKQTGLWQTRKPYSEKSIINDVSGVGTINKIGIGEGLQRGLDA